MIHGPLPSVRNTVACTWQLFGAGPGDDFGKRFSFYHPIECASIATRGVILISVQHGDNHWRKLEFNAASFMCTDNTTTCRMCFLTSRIPGVAVRSLQITECTPLTLPAERNYVLHSYLCVVQPVRCNVTRVKIYPSVTVLPVTIFNPQKEHG